MSPSSSAISRLHRAADGGLLVALACLPLLGPGGVRPAQALTAGTQDRRPAQAQRSGAAAAPASTTRAARTQRLGSHGTAVRQLQRTLARTGYLPTRAVDGAFGVQTWNAVVAFQGWNGLPRDGVVGPRTSAALTHARRPLPWSRAEGYEVHIARQVLLLVRGGTVQRAVHVSTGMPGLTTPVGHFAVTRRETMSWSVPFKSWMPLAQYFYGGYAMHEYPEVPSYPASHGCIRVPESEALVVWRFGRVGMRLWTTP